jgi:hypothetical protein
MRPGTVAHVVIPATWEVETGGLQFEASPKQKVSQILSQRISCVWWYMSIIPVTWEEEVGESWFKSGSIQKTV